MVVTPIGSLTLLIYHTFFGCVFVRVTLLIVDGPQVNIFEFSLLR